MSTLFNIAAYGNSALYLDPNGIRAQPSAPRFMLAGLPVYIGHNTPKSVVSGYTGFAGEINGRRSNTIKTIPVRIGPKYGLFPMSWNYATGN